MNRRDLFRSALGLALTPLAARLPAAEATPLSHFSGLAAPLRFDHLRCGTFFNPEWRFDLTAITPRGGTIELDYSWDTSGDLDHVAASAWVGDGGPAA